MQRKIVLKDDLKEGDNVIVHTSLSSLGFVCGGAAIEWLRGKKVPPLH